MSKVPISVCIIAKNEEKYIEECLRHLKPYGFEIIVTDTGSTDRTKEIAQKYADKVLDFEWIDDFSAARNFCMEHASNNWILALDCDEYVESINMKDVRILMQRCVRMPGMIELVNIVNSKHGRSFTTEKVTRFYNKNFFIFENPIHEQIVPKKAGNKDVIEKQFLVPIKAIHHGYDISPEELKEKQERNLRLLRKSLEKDPENPYILFQIGQSEYLVNNYEDAIIYLNKALEYAPTTELEYVVIAICDLAQTYREVSKYKEAMELMERYKDECTTARFVFMNALVYLDNEEYLKALTTFLKATTLPDAQSLGENFADCYGNIINIYRRMGENDMADMFLEKYKALQDEKAKLLNS